MRHTRTIFGMAASCVLALSCLLAFSSGPSEAGEVAQVAKAPAGHPGTARLTAAQVAQPVSVPASSTAASRLTVAQVTQPLKLPANRIATAAICAECHDSESKTHVFHGECTTCHVNAKTHAAADSPRKESPGLPKAEQCLACHQSGKRAHWAGSQHQSQDLSCASCHSLHSATDPVLTKATQSKVCESCHLEQRAQMLKSSHMPVREGKMGCVDCHNPHGSVGPKMLVGATINDACFTCHADKRGPFLFEHAPVRESCANCHNPHGSNNPGMLASKGSFLCLTCHQFGGHPNIPRYNRVSSLTGQGCVNCHNRVHGSNHPSGSKFTR